MTTSAYYVHERQDLIDEIKRLNGKIKTLREQKKKVDLLLYEYMVSNNLDEVGNVKIKTVTPKVKIQRKKKKDADRDARETLRQAGVDDPDSMWKTLRTIHIARVENTEEGVSHTR